MTLSFIVPFFVCNVRFDVFNIYILPQILYASPVWYHFLLKKDRKRLKTFVKYCAKIFRLDQHILLQHINSSAKKEFERTTKAIYSNKAHPLHSNIKNLLQECTTYNLRNKSLTPKYRIERFKNSCVYRAARFMQGTQLENLI